MIDDPKRKQRNDQAQTATQTSIQHTFTMQLKTLLLSQLVVFTALAAPSNVANTERDIEELFPQPVERDIEGRAWSFYAGGGGCLTGWNGQCNFYCKDNIRTQAEYKSCVLTGSE